MEINILATIQPSMTTYCTLFSVIYDHSPKNQHDTLYSTASIYIRKQATICEIFLKNITVLVS